MRLVRARDADLEVLDEGLGEPVLFIQTALLADELVPLARQVRRLGSYRSIVHHRRGYAGSSPARSPGSVVRDAADCLALLSALGVERTHVVGVSYSSAVALQLAVDAPAAVQTLTLLEPPPVSVASADEFRAACARLIRLFADQGGGTTLDAFMSMLAGADWRLHTERQLPGSVEQMEADAETFFRVDLPALLSWRFTAADAGAVRCPVLHVCGTESGEWFRQVREQVLGWFPQAGDVVIDGADHTLAITHPAEIAAALVPFLQREPLGARW